MTTTQGAGNDASAARSLRRRSLSGPIIECEASKAERRAEHAAALAAAVRLIRFKTEGLARGRCQYVDKPCGDMPCGCNTCAWHAHALAFLRLVGEA